LQAKPWLSGDANGARDRRQRHRRRRQSASPQGRWWGKALTKREQATNIAAAGMLHACCMERPGTERNA
jgi:hypothetical protein